MTIIQKGAPVCHVVVTLLMMMYQVEVCYSSISASLASVSASTSRLSSIYNNQNQGNHKGHNYLQIPQGGFLPQSYAHIGSGTGSHSESDSDSTASTNRQSDEVIDLKNTNDHHNEILNIISLLRGGGSGSRGKSRGRSMKGGRRKKRSILKNKKEKTIIAETKTRTNDEIINSNNNNNNNNINNTNNNSHHLPTIEAILIPRKLSIPHIIRLVSAILFTSSLIECLRTAGIPFTNAVIDVLLSHGIKPQYMNKEQTTGTSTDADVSNSATGTSNIDNTVQLQPQIISVSPFDTYMAKKIVSSSPSTLRLPPQFIPQPVPFIGLCVSLFLYLGLSLLFPIWFIQFETWLNYNKVNVNTNVNVNVNDDSKTIISTSTINEINHYLDNTKYDNIDDNDNDDYFYQSQFLNRPLNKKSRTDTGLAVLVHLSKQDQEMGEEGGKTHVIQWLRREEGDYDDDNENERYYIELNQRRIYVDIDIQNETRTTNTNKSLSLTHHDDLSYYSITTKCIDASPTFYKTESLQQLHSRLYNGIISTSSSNISSSKLTNKSIQTLEKYQNKYEKYNKLSLPIPTIQKAFTSRISKPLSIMQFMGKLLSILEDDSLAPSIMNIMSTLGQHYWSAMRSIVSAKELAGEIQGNVEDDVGEKMFWTLRPKKSLRKKKKNKKRTKKKRLGRHTSDIEVQEEELEEVIRKQWELIPSSKILPGDVFCFPPNNDVDGTRINPYATISQKTKKNTNKNMHGIVMPVDALLLEGSCVALEAVITGESVPQAKVAMDVDESSTDEAQSRLSLDTTHRSSALFAGTSVMQCTNDAYEDREDADRLDDGPKLPKKFLKSLSNSSIQPVKCLALRTGSYSSKGEIVRALSKSKSQTGSISTPQNELDSMRLISVLTTFAVVACATLFIPAIQSKGGDERTVSTFRRIIQCTRIAVASIPSDLPLALSYVAHSCSTQLKKDADVVCSEPGALLTTSQVDMVVFDKTGTLTSDTQCMKMVVPPPVHPIKDTREHHMTNVVLAGCHSLVTISKNKNDKKMLIGDPLDIASLEYSKWTFDSSAKKAYSTRLDKKKNGDTSGPKAAKMLWQIKTFPFDATRRRSSALVLVQYGDELRLLKVMKGSPEEMKSFVNFSSHRKRGLIEENYTETIEKLGSQGLRVITMAAKDITSDESIFYKLFPKGLPRYSPKNDKDIHKMISHARKIAQGGVSMNDIEKISSYHFDLVGFSCFDTVIRPSTARVIRDLKASDTNICMLTGDSPDAALAVARNAGFYEKKKNKRSVLLDVDGNDISWTITSKAHKSPKTKVDFCFTSVKSILEDEKGGQYEIVVTGRAIDNILESISEGTIDDKHIACLYFMHNLNQISVISRSSPNTKQSVISSLKKYCDMNVMMCGDGVNDIAAMKTADISAALLTGYGKEVAGADSVDIENERRISKLSERQIGNNRLDATRHPKQIRTREEKLALRKGGAAAARVLAQDEMLKNSVLSKTSNKAESNAIEKVDEVQIKPGEASLAAPFTFLRPCVDGAESILRSGIAAAAFSLSCHRSIALNSLMACFNLATLYRNGFRYGKYMWNIELSLIMAMDQGQQEISSMPRARVSKIRPHDSIFHPSSALSILLQSICHLFTLTYGHHAATLIEKKYGDSFNKGVTVRLINPELFGPIGELFKSSTCAKDGKVNIFGRTPFKPNHVTNSVFILSCFQNTIISLVNHIGAPFHGRVFESRTFCFWICASFLFCVAAATEAFPPLNKLLELAPMPSKQSKILILSLMVFDGLISFVADRLCIFLLDRRRWNEMTKPEKVSRGKGYAADFEEDLLCQERNMNKAMSLLFGLVGLVLTLTSI